MLFKATDRRFAEAGADPTKRDALIDRLKRERKGLLIVEGIILVVIFGLGGWGIAIANQVVQDALRSGIQALHSRPPGWGHDLDTVKLIIVVICVLMFYLAGTHLELRQTDT